MRKALLAMCVLLAVVPAASADEWQRRTLDFQYRLGSTVPLVNAPWVGTHNSFNSSTEPPTASGSDPNQVTTLTQQLDMGVRSLELDVHNIVGTPVVCHGLGADQGHAGCTTERSFAARLPELRAWLDAHPKEVLLLYLEDHLEGIYDQGAQVLQAQLGPKLYEPPPGTCTQMPKTISRRDILRAGKQVLIMSNCGEGTAWRGLVFASDERAKYEGQPRDFHPEKECGFQDRFQRFYEDSTRLTAQVDQSQGIAPAPLTPAVTKAMVRCGVDLLGFDQLTEDDGRLAATLWTWAPGQPSTHGCVVLRVRFAVARCGARHRSVCRSATGALTISPRFAPYARRPKGCRRGLPRTAYEASRLHAAAQRHPLWIKLRT